MAEALAKAEELNGPELAAKFRSQLRDPLAARLKVIPPIWIILSFRNLCDYCPKIILTVSSEGAV